MEEIIFDAKEAARGIYVRPQPPLPFRAPVITVERGEILPAAWEEDCFVYPANQRALAAEAARAVSEHFPTIDISTPNLRVFACPRALADKFDWDWSKKSR